MVADSLLGKTKIEDSLSRVFVDPFWDGCCDSAIVVHMLGSTDFQCWSVMKLVAQFIIFGMVIATREDFAVLLIVGILDVLSW